jgi:hypothetical protein
MSRSSCASLGEVEIRLRGAGKNLKRELHLFQEKRDADDNNSCQHAFGGHRQILFRYVQDCVATTVAFFGRVVPFCKSIEFNYSTLTAVPSEAVEQPRSVPLAL